MNSKLGRAVFYKSVIFILTNLANGVGIVTIIDENGEYHSCFNEKQIDNLFTISIEDELDNVYSSNELIKRKEYKPFIIDDNKTNEKHKCNCDTFNLINFGCKCGGI